MPRLVKEKKMVDAVHEVRPSAKKHAIHFAFTEMTDASQA